ncbi:hypothetical protein C8R43DRAFT_985298 [Mycena crocata]|nr:hypothetical protein C8R43DRAFT_985298 [Mycena crocata]
MSTKCRGGCRRKLNSRNTYVYVCLSSHLVIVCKLKSEFNLCFIIRQSCDLIPFLQIALRLCISRSPSSFFSVHSSQIFAALYAAPDRGSSGVTFLHPDLSVSTISTHALATTWFCVNKINGPCGHKIRIGALHNGHSGDLCQRPHASRFENMRRKIHSAQNE